MDLRRWPVRPSFGALLEPPPASDPAAYPPGATDRRDGLPFVGTLPVGPIASAGG